MEESGGGQRIVQVGKLRKVKRAGAEERKNHLSRSLSLSLEARLYSSRVCGAPVFKIAAESQLICLKPSCGGATVE